MSQNFVRNEKKEGQPEVELGLRIILWSSLQV